MKEFPYKIIFSSKVKCVISKEKDKYLSLASLNDIKTLIPNVDAEVNIDLLPIAANAFIANRFNKNGDGIDGETAVKYAKYFVNKPINIGHNRNSIVGTILTYGFKTFGSDKDLTEEELNELVKEKKPFNVTLGGILWRIASEDLTEYIEASNDPESENYLKPSFSWEIGFSDYDLYLIKGESRNLEDGELVPENKKNILEASLKQSGGTGKIDDNTYVYRLAKNEVLPLGIGITETPAADVKGIATEETITKIEIDNQENTSHLIKNDVITNELQNNTNMKVKEIKKIEDITDDSLKEIKASEMSEFITEQIKSAVKEAQDKLQQEVSAKEQVVTEQNTKIANLEKQTQDLTTENSTLKTELEKVNKQIAELQQAEENRKKLETFSARMSELDNTYQFADDQRKVVAEEIRDIDDAAFDNYKKRLDVLIKKTSKASENTTQNNSQTNLETVINNGKKTETVPNTTKATESLTDRMKKAFNVETGFEIKN